MGCCDESVALEQVGVGAHHRGTPVILIADDTTITVVAIRTGEILAINQIQPEKTYWRDTMKAPGRWPEASKT